MFFRKKTYKINPSQLEVFNDFFHNYLLPNQLIHGSRLVGRWTNEQKDEIMAIWEYESKSQYEQIEESIRKSDLHKRAQERRRELGELFIDSKQDFWTSTAEQGSYHPPKHIVAVAGYITNEAGEVLLVRNEHRNYTLEIPGGLVEEGESLVEAIHREIYEETGAKVKLTGVSGINQNLSSGNVSVTFSGEFVSGDLRIAEGETKEVFFQKVDHENIEELIPTPQLRHRTLDAMKGHKVPHQAYRSRPSFELVHRFEGNRKDKDADYN